MEGRGPGACLGLCASPPWQLVPHKALGFNLIYQLLPDDLTYPPLCQSLPKSLTCAQSRPMFPTTDLMSHKCPRPSLSEDNSPSSPNLTIHPPPQPGPGLMNSHNHTLFQSHTHTIRSSSSRKEQIQKLPLSDARVPSAGVEGRGPQPVWTVSQTSKSGSYRPKKLVLLGPRFFYAGRFTSVIMEDLASHLCPSWEIPMDIKYHHGSQGSSCPAAPLRDPGACQRPGVFKQQLQPPTKPAGSRGSQHLV